MVMRFRGGGVGHASTRAATDVFKKDRDAMDINSRDARQKEYVEAQEGEGNDELADSEADSVDDQGDDDDDLSESELVDYGYEKESDEEESEEEEEEAGSDDEEAGEDAGIVEELAALGFGEY